MASETLSVPEEHLMLVVHIIREGLLVVEVPEDVAEALNYWCDEEEAYWHRLQED